MYKIAAVFDCIKFEKDEPELLEWEIIHSHPALEGWFLFQEDVWDNLFDLETSEWDKLLPNHEYRGFLVLKITPTYSYHIEYGKDFDGWDWEVLVLTFEDLGEVEDDSSLQSE